MITENQFHQQLERSETMSDLLIEIAALIKSVDNLGEKQGLLSCLKKAIEKL